MTFEHTSHTSEIGFIAKSETLEGAFVEAAKAITAIMTADTVKQERSVQFSVSAESKESLLFEFLDYLVFLLDTESLFVSDGEVSIEQKDTSWVLSGTLHGDDVKNYECHGDVKAPTYHSLRVEQKDGLWELEALVDV